MIIDGLPALATPTTGDEMPIERGTATYKVTFDNLSNVIVSQLDIAFNGDSWTLADMYPIMAKVAVPGSALLWLSPTSSGLLSGEKVRAYCTCIASRTNQSNWRFMAFGGSDAYVYVWHIDGWSGASATPTIGTVYRLAGTAI